MAKLKSSFTKKDESPWVVNKIRLYLVSVNSISAKENFMIDKIYFYRIFFCRSWHIGRINGAPFFNAPAHWRSHCAGKKFQAAAINRIITRNNNPYIMPKLCKAD
jgi:hypothetical protein